MNLTHKYYKLDVKRNVSTAVMCYWNGMNICTEEWWSITVIILIAIKLQGEDKKFGLVMLQYYKLLLLFAS